MINLLKNIIQIFNEKFVQYEQLRVNAENEYLAMSCGSFNPRFLARVKRSKAEKKMNMNKKIPLSDVAVSAN